MHARVKSADLPKLSSYGNVIRFTVNEFLRLGVTSKRYSIDSDMPFERPNLSEIQCKVMNSLVTDRRTRADLSNANGLDNRVSAAGAARRRNTKASETNSSLRFPSPIVVFHPLEMFVASFDKIGLFYFDWAKILVVKRKGPPVGEEVK